MKLWTIAILTINGREKFYDRIIDIISPQIINKPIDLLILKDDRQKSIGEKRQIALDLCESEYISFIDDDDVVSSSFVDRILLPMKKFPHGIGFRGIITSPNSIPIEFAHNAGYKYSEKAHRYGKSLIYTRPLNHLNPVMIDIAREIGYKPLMLGEDYDYAIRLSESGLVRDCAFVDEFLYFYQWRGINKKI
jgi:hypothetical protein